VSRPRPKRITHRLHHHPESRLFCNSKSRQNRGPSPCVCVHACALQYAGGKYKEIMSYDLECGDRLEMIIERVSVVYTTDETLG
jgi:hypothetical protein